MSRIEDQAKKVLLPLIRGAPRTLSATAQVVVARWAQLKWISVSALEEAETPLSSRAKAFAKSPDPMSDVEVQIGAYAFDPMRVESPFLKVWGGAHRLDGPPLDVVRVYITFKHLVLVAGGPVVPTPGSRPRTPFETPQLLRCWPEPDLGGIRWPPSRLTTHDWIVSHAQPRF